ncbi:MAG TPA: COX15/CtaA family protein [Burkholderiales bacterium]|nr:COX15/CtaA family protein [Burkholderiales bacterium]
MKRLALATVVLTFVVVVVGAYVRLSDAGLGCPDWPLCYGRAIPDELEDAKAWKEMGHRYLAGALGILIFVLALAAWRTRQSPWLATAIAALVVLQATLGKWTVTMLLKPAIVVAHLAGGMALLALLVWFLLEASGTARLTGARVLRLPAIAALLVLVMQILLGGWVSANTAALACPDLPLCLGQAVPPMDFANAFHILRELGRTDAGELLPQAALVAIHWSHRMFALVVLAVVAWAAWRTFRVSRRLGTAITLLLLIQFSLGVANVAFNLPLALAAAHNAGAAAMVVSLVVLNFFAFREHTGSSP